MAGTQFDDEPGLARAVARWLYNTGYPFDWCMPDMPPPDDVMPFLIKFWAEDEGITDWNQATDWVTDEMRGDT